MPPPPYAPATALAPPPPQGTDGPAPNPVDNALLDLGEDGEREEREEDDEDEAFVGRLIKLTSDGKI